MVTWTTRCVMFGIAQVWSFGGTTARTVPSRRPKAFVSASPNEVAHGAALSTSLAASRTPASDVDASGVRGASAAASGAPGCPASGEARLEGLEEEQATRRRGT